MGSDSGYPKKVGMFWRDSFPKIFFGSQGDSNISFEVVRRLFKSMKRHVEENIHFNDRSIEKSEVFTSFVQMYFTPRKGPMFAKE
jgi:hypothetical protein